jgi:uncharacterized protein (TIGR02145 family)/uncharacterized repeat protein (TIGR02543 family)
MTKLISRIVVPAIAAALTLTACNDGVGGSDDFNDNYGRTMYTLTTGASPEGSGTITRNPSAERYPSGTQVTVRAIPEDGYVFTRWTNPSVPATREVTIIMDENRVLTALFSLISTDHHTLTVHLNPTDGSGGRVVREPEETAYTFGEEVVIRAIPNEGYRFVGWTGSLESPNAEETIIIIGDMTVTAQFQQTFTLRTTSSPAIGGNAMPTQQTDIVAGTPVNITATPASGYKFVNWTITDGIATIANAISTNTTVILNLNTTIRANFLETHQNPNIDYGSFIDSRDGRSYSTVVIGTQAWMAENLNYSGSDDNTVGVCYGNISGNCDMYGRLYNWATVMGLPSTCNSSTCAGQVQSPHRGICPAGWHVPSDDDWETLIRYVDPNASGDWDNIAGMILKSKSGWDGTDDFGFSALPGGGRYAGGYFLYAGEEGGYWWSTTNMEYDASYAWGRYMYWNSCEWDSYYDRVKCYGEVGRGANGKAGSFSLRCLMTD